MAVLFALLNCESRTSPVLLGAMSVQSPGSHWSGSGAPAGLHDQICAPMLVLPLPVLRAAMSFPFQGTKATTDRSEGSRPKVLLVITWLLDAKAAPMGVLGAQSPGFVA